MKRLFLSLLVVFALASNAFATAGSCSNVVSFAASQGVGKITFTIVTFTCTFGTGANATDALTSTLKDADTALVTGWYLFMATTYNGSTAPTALYDLYLKETVDSTANAVDILGTAGMNRPGTAGTSSQFAPIKDTTYVVTGVRPVLNTLTLTASGNAVDSGAFIAQFIFAR